MDTQMEKLLEHLNAAGAAFKEDLGVAEMELETALRWAERLYASIVLTDARRQERNMARRQRAADKRAFAALEVN